ncbi:MAG: Selenocysteine-specific elongation factor [candidate division WS2 bacterium]|nr:Selenocysteine-specific elongation factor [Candidatus Psychracetigena formicireducens]MBT9149862.1 Selenocysteine-specific elongation factor [Candidatus Psychracetigena formicireducens]
MRNYLVVGTAGHIDHGKTRLVKSLTGMETDRLKEEKERGISIELGYAYLKLPSGIMAGFIDVPGHEGLVRKMISGCYGIDLALLVVAADEGFMPQTYEHLAILNLLGLPKGIIVVTKIDMVSDNDLSILEEDIREGVKNSFLENAPIVYTSTATNMGIGNLIELIDSFSLSLPVKDTTGPFRLFIDRVFSLPGFGTVITGTAFNGLVKKGQSIEILPKGVTSRVRSIEVHYQSVEEAFAGERAALNLPDIKVNQIKRGEVICTPQAYKPTSLLDLKIELLKGKKNYLLKHGQRIRFYHGSNEVLGRVLFTGLGEIRSGETCMAQVYLEEPVVAREGDRFIIRSYSPINTIGGGVILDPYAIKRRKKTPLNSVVNIEDSVSRYVKILNNEQSFMIDIPALSFLSQKEEEEIIKELLNSDKFILLPSEKPLYVSLNTRFEENKLFVKQKLQAYHQVNPHSPGFLLEELRNKLTGLDVKQFRIFIKHLIDSGMVEVNGQIVRLKGLKAVFSGEWLEGRTALLKLIAENKLSPPTIKELVEIMEKQGWKKDKLYNLLKAMVEATDIIKVSEELVFLPSVVESIKRELMAYLWKKEEISPGDFKDLFNISRKYAIPLLEWFDHQKITFRDGNVRKLRNKQR